MIWYLDFMWMRAFLLAAIFLTQITNGEFARLTSSLSEPEGYFDTDNFISNEAGYLKILPLFGRMGIRGGAYLGVGPDQNYSYIAAIKPELAVLVDVRRQNQLQHYLYKALFSLSGDRNDFLERLFGKRLSRRSNVSLTDLLDQIEAAPRHEKLIQATVQDIKQYLGKLPLNLSGADFEKIEYIERAFFDGGPRLKFSSFRRAPNPQYPTYRELLLETDAAGAPGNYLATEERFQVIRQMHRENRIIPVVGDLSGSVALAQIARELRARNLRVSSFYVSNVEFYLFDTPRWDRYVRNIRALPWTDNAVIIRSVSNNWRAHPASLPGYYMTTILQRRASFLLNENSGRNATYWDVVTADYIGPK
jgi:hypothetical protein